MEAEKEKNRARDQAKAQLDGIIAMVDRLRHCQECQDPECDLTDEEIYEGLNLYYKEGDKASEEEREQYHDEDEARQAIDEDPLSVQIRGGWHSPGEADEAIEYEILLCTGGPACRIIGDLGQFNEPENARLQYQDWFTPWEDYHMNANEEEYVVDYARSFYFGD